MWGLYYQLPAKCDCIEDELNMTTIEQVEQDAEAIKRVGGQSSMPSTGQTSHEAVAREYHVASFVAQVIESEMAQVKQAIEQINGSEIHVVSPEGKIVFTLEGSHQGGIGKNIDGLKYHPGLLSLAPVYHQFITEDSDTDSSE